MGEVLPFKSKRKVEEEVAQYYRNRFEYHMEMVDRGETTRELALAAFMAETLEDPDDAA